MKPGDRGLEMTLVLAALLLVGYAVADRFFDVGAGSIASMTLGWTAAAMLLVISLLGVRKRAMKLATRLKAGRSSLWLWIHLYGGSLFLLLVLMHSNFGWPRGWVTTWLWGLSLWTVAGGLIGRGLQFWIPRLMTSGLSNEVLYERIPELVDDLGKRATDLSSECGPEIRDLYDRRIAPELAAPKRHIGYFFDITGGINERLRPVRFLRAKLSDEEAVRLDDLENLYRAKLEIDAHYTLQQALRTWLWIHLPPALLLWVFLAMHLWGVLRY